MYLFDIFLFIYKLDILFLPCISIISLSQWFVQRYIQVTSHYGRLLYHTLFSDILKRESLLKAGLLKWLV